MPNIAILGQPNLPVYEVLRGVYDYAASAEDWNIEFFRLPLADALSNSLAWQAHGLITCLDTMDAAADGQLMSIGVPIVNVGQRGNVPSVCVNHQSVAALIARHLEGVPVQRLALICAPNQVHWENGFASTFGDKLDTIQLELTQHELQSTKPRMPLLLQQWLRVPKPSTIVATNDALAAFVCRALAAEGISVPRDIAVISIGDSLSCSLPNLSLTAVLMPDREMGYQAARKLHRLLSGHPSNTETLVVDAFAIVCRSSSQESSVDSAMARAVRFIQENATRGITVADVMAFQQTSRVTFERQFQASLGCSPGEFIRKTRVEKAKDLLLGSTLAIDAIGKSCGFQSPAKFSSFFKRAEGISPAQFRRRNQAADESSQSR